MIKWGNVLEFFSYIKHLFSIILKHIYINPDSLMLFSHINKQITGLYVLRFQQINTHFILIYWLIDDCILFVHKSLTSGMRKLLKMNIYLCKHVCLSIFSYKYKNKISKSHTESKLKYLKEFKGFFVKYNPYLREHSSL